MLVRNMRELNSEEFTLSGESIANGRISISCRWYITFLVNLCVCIQCSLERLKGLLVGREYGMMAHGDSFASGSESNDDNGSELNELEERLQSSYHRTVLLKEAVDLLDPAVGKLIVDATLGGGGHTRRIFTEACQGHCI